MELLCQEFNIPKKQIKETNTKDRFIVITKKTWLRNLNVYGKILEFPIHFGLDEWPSYANKIEYSWCKVHFQIYKKQNHKVIPLPRYRNEQNENDIPLTYSQLLHYVSQSNHKNLWKSSYKQYSSSRINTLNESNTTTKKSSSDSIILLPYDNVLREVIMRMYNCNIIDISDNNYENTPGTSASTSSSSTSTSHCKSNSMNQTYESHCNLYPVISVIETNTQFVLIFDSFTEFSLYDCITYSPSILEKSYNKPLFIIYQILHLMKSLHEKGLLLGEINLNDIYMTENLWLQIIPRLDCNAIKLEEIDSYLVATSKINTSSPSRNPNNMQGGSSITNNTVTSGGVTNPIEFYSKYKFLSTQELYVSYTLKDYCELWCHGQISNFDYLTILNNLAGRRLGCPGYHHIMPWVTDFTSRSGMNWRDLSKSKYRLNKGDPQLDLMYSSSNLENQIPHHVSDVLSEITYYVYMARRTQKSVLCRHVRPIWVPAEYPASIQRLQEWTPDECIPEFYNDPTVFKSIHEDLPDLEVPAWSSCPENFIIKHREALESQIVSEKLHHWIDLTFGYKLTGQAAVKSKNVCLSLVDEHKNIIKHGVVQLFQHPHPPKQFSSIWAAKLPPRIYPQNEIKRRLTRSSEDLSISSNQTNENVEFTGESQQKNLKNLGGKSIGSVDESNPNMERSPSYHMNVVQKSSNVIILPKDYNPIGQLQAVENMEIFMGKIFHHNLDRDRQSAIRSSLNDDGIKLSNLFDEFSDNSYTNRIFTENFEATILKNGKNNNKNFKQIIAERRMRELQILGCVIVEMFLSNKLRPMDGGTISIINQSFEKRLSSCLKLLKYEFDQLPKCVQYPVKLLLNLNGDKSVITEKGLPNPSAHQFLQPLLSNSLFPFPGNFIKIYYLIKTLHQFSLTFKLLNLLTFFECDGKNCSKYETIDRSRIALHRKIAECKVKSCVIQIKGLLEPIAFEQFSPIELLLPHVIDLIRNDDTSIMAAWYLFDPIAIALGTKDTQKYLLEPILQLYDAENDNRMNIISSNIDSSAKVPTSAAFKNKKSYKLYHHSFLLKLIVRFGLKCFLDNFIAPIIEGVGGYKDPDQNCILHAHESNLNNIYEIRKSRSTKNFNYDSGDLTEEGTTTNTLISPVISEKSSDKTISPSSENSFNNSKHEELFEFENEPDTGKNLTSTDVILKIIDQFDFKSDGNSLDLKLNHSHAEEVTEFTPINDDHFQINSFLYRDDNTKFSTDLGQLNSSFDEEVLSYKSVESPQKSPGNILDHSNEPKSPTIPIPTTFHLGKEVNSIGCEIGSKKSFDSSEFLMQTNNKEDYNEASTVSSINSKSVNVSTMNTIAPTQPSRISEMSAESLIWLSHRLGPVLTARYLTRNLLKMLTLCFVGQENLFPDQIDVTDKNFQLFSIADSRVVGDRNAMKVLECLTGISALFGEQFILLQYFPHMSELIALCKKRITPSLEGGLISSLQLLKYLVPCLNDSTIMDQLHDIILRSIIHPIIRLLGSSRCIMPNGYLARNVLARKLLDTLYVLAIRIGPEMTREHLCVPALQRFFFIFNKAYGIKEHSKYLEVNNQQIDASPTNSDDCNFIEIRRDGGIREWSVKGSPIQISHARIENEDSFESITPPQILSTSAGSGNDLNVLKEKALEEIQDVFTPNLAHTAYLIFLKYLGENVMSQSVKNLPLILNLCHEYEHDENGIQKKVESTTVSDDDDASCSNNFGTNVAVVGNRIEVQTSDIKSDPGPSEILNIVTYKLDQINTSRHLRGNWLAYWEHEIGRSDKDNHFNLKQIKLQSFHGHTNSVRSILPLDNENSFMSASKDKTVKLWSLRSEGDGTKISQCQYTYTNHKKSVHSLTFLESLRLAVSCDSGVHLWDPFVGNQLGQLDSSRFSPVSVVKTFPAPSSLVICGTADASVKTIDTRIFNYVNEWKTSTAPSGSVRCMAVSPSGLWIAVGLSSGQLVLLDGKSGIIISSWKANEGELLQLVAPNDSQLISSSLDHSISVWNTNDGSLLYQLKSPPEPAHCLICNGGELITGTPANRIGVYSSLNQDCIYSITKLRSENFRGVLTSLAILPLNRMLLIGGDSGNISLLC